MHEKRQKIEFLDLKNLHFSGIFLSGIGGYPPPPSTDKISYVVFDRFPYPKHGVCGYYVTRRFLATEPLQLERMLFVECRYDILILLFLPAACGRRC